MPLQYLEALPKGSPSQPSRARRTLVLLHAFPLNAEMWRRQLALADEGWRVIAPHLRGMAGANAPSITSMDDYVGDVIDLLDALHIDEAVIGGLSMGGYVTLGLFRHAPRYFTGMILADTKSPADSPEALEGRKKARALVREKGRQALLDDMLPKLVGKGVRETQPALIEELRSIVALNSDEAVDGAIIALSTRQDSTPLLSSIHCPVLVVVGEDDALTPPELSRQMHSAIAGSELVVLSGAGHLSSLEQPGAFTDAVRQFLLRRL